MSPLWKARQRKEALEESAGAHVAVAAQRAVEEIAELKRRVEALSVLCRAMWSLLEQRQGLSEKDLIERMQQIRKQSVDKPAAPAEAPTCGQCGRPVIRSQRFCPYCGAERAPDSAFEAI